MSLVGSVSMVKGDTKCFSSGSSAPVMNHDGMILYSMRFCPFAERIRIVLEAKEIPYEIININLRSKPDWFLERNPLGEVPTIEEPGHKLIYESLILAEYLDDKYDSGLRILPKDLLERAKQKMMVHVIWEKFLVKFGMAQFQGGEANFKAVVAGLNVVESMLTDYFFSGPTVGFVDMMVWPWLARLPNLKDLCGFNIQMDSYPTILKWTDRMYELPFIRKTVYPAELVCKFAKEYIRGRPNYDEGL